MSNGEPELVSFITVEEEDLDLIVAFAVDLGEPGEVASVILMRTPAYEPLLPEEDRGMHVSHELYPEEGDDYEMVRRLRWTGGRVEIVSTLRRYVLDVSRVDAEEVRDAWELLRRMNFDGRSELDLS